ncbi:HNH endonuclease [Mumia sp. DW29H23]|uniref:HNH endonuclease n=1 Tax=Mumia sp. DW29H23 TaxID=3421241 RepID=UPI003D692E93
MTAVPTAVRQDVYDRDAHRCVRCGKGGQLTIQHRIGRGMGGTRDPKVAAVSNLLALCGSGTTGCHGWVEHHPILADAHGWSAPRRATTTAWAVYSWRGWIALSDDYGVDAVDPPGPDTDQGIALASCGCDCGCLTPPRHQLHGEGPM